jgi:hypothetical protein
VFTVACVVPGNELLQWRAANRTRRREREARDISARELVTPHARVDRRRRRAQIAHEPCRDVRACLLATRRPPLARAGPRSHPVARRWRSTSARAPRSPPPSPPPPPPSSAPAARGTRCTTPSAALQHIDACRQPNETIAPDDGEGSNPSRPALWIGPFTVVGRQSHIHVSLPFGCRQAHGWFLAVVWTLE